MATADARHVYESVASTPVVTSGRIMEDCSTVTQSQKHIPSHTKRTFVQTFIKQKGYIPIGVANCDRERVFSSDGAWSAAVFDAEDNKEDSPSQCIEVWNKGEVVCLAQTKGKCGKVDLTGTPFGGCAFTHDGSTLVFVAERWKPKKASFWDTEGDRPGYAYDLEEHWGEQLSHTVSTGLFRLNTTKSDINTLEMDLEKLGIVAAGQVALAPNDADIVFVGWEKTPRKLGTIFYNTRPTALFKASLDAAGLNNVTRIRALGPTPTCPRFNPSGSKLVYLSTEQEWVHNACSFLCCIDWQSQKSSILIPISNDEQGFTGLWRQLNLRCWCSDTKLALSTVQRSRGVVYTFDVESKQLEQVHLPNSLASYCSMHLLDVMSDRLLVSISDPVTKPSVYCCSVQTKTPKWECILEGKRVSECDVSIQQHTPKHGPAMPFDSILIHPKCPNRRIIVWPHGGPHSGYTTTYMTAVAYLAAMGYTLILANYRGSIGFGQAFLASLPGFIGDFDLADTMQALHECPPVMQKYTKLIMGGSHGGYLTTMAIGKHPGVFQAAVARNPVTNIAHSTATTDIPDWGFTECGLLYDPTRAPTQEEMGQMYAMSPIAFVDVVTTPLMLMLGDKDRRVPMTQGIDYFKLLQAKKAKARCLVYPENQHGLVDKMQTESDMWVNVAQWLMQ